MSTIYHFHAYKDGLVHRTRT